ncbi:MAG: hypothetical protein V3U52_03935 [Thermoplasmata archaeon]
MENKPKEREFSHGVWELEICIVCKFPLEYCICAKIHTGGD